jgi:hypothetical protein
VYRSSRKESKFGPIYLLCNFFIIWGKICLLINLKSLQVLAVYNVLYYSRTSEGGGSAPEAAYCCVPQLPVGSRGRDSEATGYPSLQARHRSELQDWRIRDCQLQVFFSLDHAVHAFSSPRPQNWHNCHNLNLPPFLGENFSNFI